MLKEKEFCDLCHLDGDDDTEAVAKYTADDNRDYAVCNEHLKDVKKVKLNYWMLENN